jgi:hypothetical protein
MLGRDSANSRARMASGDAIILSLFGVLCGLGIIQAGGYSATRYHGVVFKMSQICSNRFETITRSKRQHKMMSLTQGFFLLMLVFACPIPCVSSWMFGFYSQDVNVTSFEAGSNLFLASDLETSVIAKSRGMSSLFYTAQFFVITFDRQSPDICKLRPTWQSDWVAFASEVAPYVSNGTVIGFWLGDELAGRCCTLDTIKLMAQTVKSSFPNSIVYYNEAATPLQEGKPCANIPKGGYHLAGAVDWFGMDM